MRQQIITTASNTVSCKDRLPLEAVDKIDHCLVQLQDLKAGKLG